MNTLNIWCANIGWKWHDNWVYRLQNMVREHCSIPYRFRCISDHEIEGVEVVSLSRELVLDKDKPQGCWAKVDAWQAPIGSLNILLDLDVCIISDLAQLVRESPAAAKDPRDAPTRPWMNGSVISWQSTACTQKVYPQAIPYVKHPRGEQEYVQEMLGNFEPLPGVYSFKGHLTNETRQILPDDAAVVFFHGYPTPASDTVQQYNWINSTWKGLERIERT